jgi:sugar phosphate isomerase/epimerase
LPFEDACQRIAAAGYTDVALFRDALDCEAGQEEVVAAAKIALDAGLNPSMLIGRTHLELDPEEAFSRYQRVIDNTATLGAPWLLDTGVGNPSWFDAYLALMRRAAPYAASAGVQITLKPHGGITLTTDDLIAAYQHVSHPAFGLCYDPGNIIFYTKGAERPETNIDRVAPLVTTGIIKDCVVHDGNPDVMVTPGTGWVDFSRVLAGLTEGGFRGPLYVECVGGTTIEEIDRNVRRTLLFVRDILAPL